jgi:hypothetical protein
VLATPACFPLDSSLLALRNSDSLQTGDHVWLPAGHSSHHSLMFSWALLSSLFNYQPGPVGIWLPPCWVLFPGDSLSSSLLRVLRDCWFQSEPLNPVSLTSFFFLLSHLCSFVCQSDFSLMSGSNSLSLRSAKTPVCLQSSSNFLTCSDHPG